MKATLSATLTAEQRATLIALVGSAWKQSSPAAEVPGGFIEAPEFTDWFNAQIDAALAEGKEA